MEGPMLADECDPGRLTQGRAVREASSLSVPVRCGRGQEEGLCAGTQGLVTVGR